MIVAEKKSSSFLIAYLLLMFGVIIAIFLIANAQLRIVLDNLVFFAIAGVGFVGVFFILPVYSLISKTEIIIDGGIITIKSYFIKEKKYVLKDLIEWQLIKGYSRYGSTTHLHLVFSNREKLNIQEREITNFDLVTKYLESNFRRIKR